MNEAQRLNRSIRRTNAGTNIIQTTDSVKDWAWRIRGLKPNQKIMLLAMANSVNAHGVCEIAVRYLADHCDVGMRQAQRLIQELNLLELITVIDLGPQQGRPNDLVRAFALKITKDPDTWRPPEGGPVKKGTTSYTTFPTQVFLEALRVRLPQNPYYETEYRMFLSMIEIVGIRSGRLEFAAPNRDVTDKCYSHEKLILAVASELTGAKLVKRPHMIPRKGYR